MKDRLNVTVKGLQDWEMDDIQSFERALDEWAEARDLTRVATTRGPGGMSFSLHRRAPGWRSDAHAANADDLYQFAFRESGRTPHSLPFREGARAYLEYRFNGAPHPYRHDHHAPGSVEHDAWKAGIEHGRFLADMRGSITPEQARETA